MNIIHSLSCLINTLIQIRSQTTGPKYFPRKYLCVTVLDSHRIKWCAECGLWDWKSDNYLETQWQTLRRWLNASPLKFDLKSRFIHLSSKTWPKLQQGIQWIAPLNPKSNPCFHFFYIQYVIQETSYCLWVLHEGVICMTVWNSPNVNEDDFHTTFLKALGRSGLETR